MEVDDDDVGGVLLLELPLDLIAEGREGDVLAPAGVPVGPQRVVDGDGQVGDGGRQLLAPVRLAPARLPGRRADGAGQEDGGAVLLWGAGGGEDDLALPGGGGVVVGGQLGDEHF